MDPIVYDAQNLIEICDEIQRAHLAIHEGNQEALTRSFLQLQSYEKDEIIKAAFVCSVDTGVRTPR